MNEPININAASFDKAVLKSPVPVLVDIWAPWCGPCRLLAPVLDDIARESENRFRIAKINADDDPELLAQFKIRGVPTLLFFSGGELRHQITGMAGKKVIVDQLEALTDQPAERN
jgi:thioredoxin